MIEFMDLVADLGWEHLSISTASLPADTYGYQPRSFHDDLHLLAATVAELDGRGVDISVGDAFVLAEELT